MTARQGLSADVLDDLDWWTRPVSERDALFAWLRANDPRPFAPELDLSGTPRGGGFWSLTRMDDIREVSRRPDDFCSGRALSQWPRRAPGCGPTTSTIRPSSEDRWTRRRRYSAAMSPEGSSASAAFLELSQTRSSVAEMASSMGAVLRNYKFT